MSTPNENGKQPENVELPKPQASACCGPGCGCEAGAKPSKARWVVGAIVLAAAGVMAVQAVVRNNRASTPACAGCFANPVASESEAGGPAGSTGAAGAADEATIGTTLGGFAELNTAAAKTDAVFVFLPAKEGTSGDSPSTPMKAAARALEAKGLKCGLFTLKPGSADYEQMAKQMAVPGVVALAKGRGISAVSGDITEAKLVQGYVAASSAGGCGPGASAGCCPK